MEQKIFFLLILVFASAALTAQQKNVIVSGKVLDSRDSSLIINAVVVLKGDDGSRREFKTTEDGGFNFELTDNKIHKAEITVEVSKATRSKTHREFLSSEDKGKFTIYDTLNAPRKFIKNFYLTEALVSYYFPEFIFKKNSMELEWSKEHFEDSVLTDPDTILSHLAKGLNYESDLVIRLDAHCSSDEKNPALFSVVKANKIRERLIALGVNPKRIVCAGFGIQKLKISDTEIKKCKTTKEKETLSSKNRRCTIKIISWDFVEEK